MRGINLTLAALLAVGVVTMFLVGRLDARHVPVTEPVTLDTVQLEGTLQTVPDYSTPVCHVVELPDPPGGTTKLYTTITTTCGQNGAPTGGRECAEFHLQKVQDFLEVSTPCPEERR